MKKVILFLFSFILTIHVQLFAQNGQSYIVNFEINGVSSDNKIKSIAFDNKYNTYIASRLGVTMFDGTFQKQINNCPTNVTALKSDSTGNIIYVASKNDFGFIFMNSTATPQYKSLKNTSENKFNFTKILINTDDVFFFSKNQIYIVNQKDKTKISKISNTKFGKFSGIISLKNNIYINIENKGIHKLTGTSLEIVSGGNRFKNSQLIFYAPYNNHSILMGTSENKIYIYNGRKFKQFSANTEIRKFLKENILWDGLKFSEESFALSTLTGGVVIIDRIYGKIKQTINYQTGLPEDEISAISIDKNNGLWIAHQYGLSRCDLNSVVKDYSSYPGIYGNINDILYFNDSIYIASNKGVNILSKIKNYKEKQIFIKEKVRYGYKFNPKLTYVLQSIDYKYTPLDNIKDKCKKLYALNDSTILAFSDFGIFRITDTTANQIIRDVYINDFCEDKDTSILYIATLKGLIEVSFYNDTALNKSIWTKNTIFSNLGSVYSVAQAKNGQLFFGTEEKAFYTKKDTTGNYSEPIEIKFPKQIQGPIQVKSLNNRIYFVQTTGIYYFNSETNKIIADKNNNIYKNGIQSLFTHNNAWIKYNNQWKMLDTLQHYPNIEYLNIYKNIKQIYSDKSNNLWVIDGARNILKIKQELIIKDSSNFEIFIISVRDKKDSSYIADHPQLSYDRNAIRIKLSAPCYISNQGNKYRYKIEGLENYETWSEWSGNSTIELTSIPPGDYTLSVSARNILGTVSEVKTMKLSVEVPFTQTNLFYSIVAISLLIFVVLIFFIGRYRLKLKNQKLEKIIAERTLQITKKNSELETQKEEISAQRDILADQKNEIETQRDSLAEKNVEIEHQNKNIKDSIIYAKNIQEAILPTEKQIQCILPENFIYYKPKDIVSGDFYWFAQRNDCVYFAAADCTGHGVPGAFLSMLGISFLNNIVNSSRKKELTPADILQTLTEQIIEALHQTGDVDEAKDGMDIALCKINKKTKKATFAGAFNPLYLVWNNEIRIIKPNNRPIGIYEFHNKVKPFFDTEFDVRKGDMLYVFSDGYIDQFGGEKDRKFNIKNFKNLCLKIHKLPINEQHKKVEEVMKKWMKNEPNQIDDMLVMGIKIS